MIVGALLGILKDMPESVLQDVYEDIMQIEITEDTIFCRRIITECILKLDVHHFELVIS